MSLLTLIQSVCKQLAIPQSNVAFTATDAKVQQLVSLAQEAGDDLQRDHDWSSLTIVRDFPGSGVEIQNEPPTVAGAFDRFAQNSYIWDIGNKWVLDGPKTPAEWQRITIDDVGTLKKWWTMFGGAIHILPVPPTTESYRYSYITKNWIRVQGGNQDSDISEWNADTNTSLMPERLLKLSMIWRWKQSRGLSYEEDMATFERDKIRAIARDRGPRQISTTVWNRDQTFIDRWLPWNIT